MLQSRVIPMVLLDFIICVILTVVTTLLVAGGTLLLTHAAQAPELPSRILAIGLGIITGLACAWHLMLDLRETRALVFDDRS